LVLSLTHYNSAHHSLQKQKSDIFIRVSQTEFKINQTFETLMLDTGVFSLPERHHQQVNVLQFDGTGDLLASGGADGLLNVWNFRCQAYVVSHRFADGISAMTWLSYSLRSQSIMVALQGGSVEQLDFSIGDVSVFVIRHLLHLTLPLSLLYRSQRFSSWNLPRRVQFFPWHIKTTY